MELTRRDFIVSTTAAGLTAPALSDVHAAGSLVAQAGVPVLRGVDQSDPAFKFDLVVANADVLDPSQNLRGRRDIGIKNGQIVVPAPSIPADRATHRYDAGGRLATPGLIDLHALRPARVGRRAAVGRAGADLSHDDGRLGRRRRGEHVRGTEAGRDLPVAHPPLRLRAHLGDRSRRRSRRPRDAEHQLRAGRGDGAHAGRESGPRARGEGAHHRLGGRPERSRAAPAGHPRGRDGGQGLPRDVSHRSGAGLHGGSARPAAAGRRAHALLHGRRQQHRTERATPAGRPRGEAARRDLRCRSRRRQLRLHGLRAGDDAGRYGGHDLERHPLRLDQHARLPDHAVGHVEVHGPRPVLEEVVARATIEPAKVIGRVPGLGTLQIGAPADIAVFELVDGPVEFVDTRRNTKSGNRKLVPVMTVRGGVPFGRPYPTPFRY